MSTFLVKHRGQPHNIKKFLKYHPGGSNTLAGLEDNDITKVLQATGHSSAAYELLKDYRVQEDNPHALFREEGDLESLVDWNKPMLGQVGKLGPKYKEWVLAPVDRKLRLLGPDFLEQLTVTPWYLIPIVWIPVTIALVYLGYLRYLAIAQYSSTFEQSSIFLWVTLPYLLGLLLWPIIEYSVHRWIFHLKPPDSSPWLITVHFSLHGLHHKVPFDDRRLLLPPVPAAVLLSIAYFIYSYLFSYWSTPLVMAGTITGYTMYDLMHFYLHYGSPKEGSYLYTMKRYHNQHHFAHHEEGFGISNNILDKIFGTLIHLKKLNRTLVW